VFRNPCFCRLDSFSRKFAAEDDLSIECMSTEIKGPQKGEKKKVEGEQGEVGSDYCVSYSITLSFSNAGVFLFLFLFLFIIDEEEFGISKSFWLVGSIDASVFR